MPDHSTAAVPVAAIPMAQTAAAPLIDIGINLAHESYDGDRAAVLERARAAGVTQMIVTGSTLSSMKGRGSR